ncbi:MAG: SRPBCC family protein [Acidimicrobiales bacterium]|jgi:ribosome-associated toxin RatA of RatAB toxin-antitoxin module|nr:SRPBCC family protein [Acidimicrobiales bacterium]MDP6298452.1 SRPBCC family protein [Acidimicrobiales bacterium]HJM28078.1 SRPBCC family protein [Acidimicrobiales bacterium]HJM97188.1 SRPBCC family protein [Acidimicrobiales bacterium]
MSDHATQRRIIDATPQQCFDVVTDFERYPDWVPDVKSATILEQDKQGRGGDVTFRAASIGRSTTYTLRYYYGSNPLRIAWRQIEGDITRKIEGEYEFVPVEEGTKTEVAYHLAVDLAILIPGFVKRRAESRIVRAALEDLSSRVESVFAS